MHRSVDPWNSGPRLVRELSVFRASEVSTTVTPGAKPLDGQRRRPRSSHQRSRMNFENRQCARNLLESPLVIWPERSSVAIAGLDSVHARTGNIASRSRDSLGANRQLAGRSVKTTCASACRGAHPVSQRRGLLPLAHPIHRIDACAGSRAEVRTSISGLNRLAFPVPATSL
jgi:hypothetical protein